MTGRGMAKKAYRYARYVAKTRPKPELKFMRMDDSGSTISINAHSMWHINSKDFTSSGDGIITGASQQQRIGNKITEHSVALKLYIRADPVGIADNTALKPVICRLIVFRINDDFDPTATPTISNILQGSSYPNVAFYTKEQDSAFVHNYKIMYDKTIMLQPAAKAVLIADVGGANTYNGTPPINYPGMHKEFKLVKLKYKLRNHVVQFGGSADKMPKRDRLFMTLVNGADSGSSLTTRLKGTYYYSDA